MRDMAGTGKILSAVGGIITIVSTFILTLEATPPIFVSGLGFTINLPDIFVSGDVVYIILGIVGIVFLISGIFQLIGISNRALAIIGSILPIALAIFIIVKAFGVIPTEITDYLTLLNGDQYFGFIPFHLQIWEFGLGTLTLLAGGVLGLIGGILPREEFYY